jgi:hypothetical protein
MYGSKPFGGLLRRAPGVPTREQGLFKKFHVERVDGQSEPGCKHHRCAYFVLDVTHDPHAIPALRAYALACASTHPQLSADILAELGGLE